MELTELVQRALADGHLHITRSKTEKIRYVAVNVAKTRRKKLEPYAFQVKTFETPKRLTDSFEIFYRRRGAGA